MKKLLFLLLLTTACGPALLAQDATTTAAPKYAPKRDEAPDSKLFPEIQSEARALNEALLKAIVKLDGLVVPTRIGVEEGFPLDGVRAFGRLVRRDAGGKLPAEHYDKLAAQLSHFEATLQDADGIADLLPVFKVTPKPTAALTTWRYFFSDDLASEGFFAKPGDEAFTVNTSRGPVPTTRIEALRALDTALDPYQLNANSYAAFKTRVQLLKLAAEWDDYFEKGRPQTFWDIALTTLMEYQHIQTDRLVGPPPRQWFLLHPNVVAEHLDAAPDGDQIGGAVAIEWIGVNWWKQKVPLGISLSSLYSDRAGVSDVGHGVTVYIANRYCIGWASHGGDNGFYASIDLLQLIDSKKGELEGFTKQLKTKLRLP